MKIRVLSTVVVAVGVLIVHGVQSLPPLDNGVDKIAQVAESTHIRQGKLSTPKPEKKEPPKEEAKPVIIDTAAQNTKVQKVELSDCEVLAQEVKKYDWDVRIALAVAKAESGCRANAVGDTTITYYNNGKKYGYSVGMFQIRILEGREHCDSFDIATNVACAYKIYRDAGSWRPWSVYTNGMYRKYLL